MARVMDSLRTSSRADAPAPVLAHPHAEQRVSLTTAVFSDMPARVVRVSADGELTLELLAPVPRTATGPRGSARVEYTVPEGLVRLFGAAGGALDLIADAEGPVLTFAAKGTPMMLLRRRHIRVDIEAELELGAELTHTIDLSAGGLLVPGPVPFQQGADIDFRLRLPDELCSIAGRARVARIDDAGNAGVEFSTITDEDRARVERTVLERRRALRAT